MAAQDNYQNIDRSYDSNLNRGTSDNLNTSKQYQATGGYQGTSIDNSSSYGGFSESTGIQINGNVERQAVKTGKAMGDIWSNSFIASTNWIPKKVGFYIDGRTGYAEFTNVFVSGEIHALTGIIGGWTIGATTLTGGGVTLNSNGTITGGTITGSTITGVTITGSTITGGTLTGGTIQTSATGNRIVLEGATNTLKFKNGAIDYASMSVYSSGTNGFRIDVGSDFLTFINGSFGLGVGGNGISVDSNGVFSSGIFFPEMYTGMTPTYVRGGMYFDGTLNKLRIGAAAGWETVTSV